jgi:hypothetical protein
LTLSLGIDVRKWEDSPEAGGSYYKILKILGLQKYSIIDPETLKDVLATCSADFVKPHYFNYGMYVLGGHSIFQMDGGIHKVCISQLQLRLLILL